MSNETFRNVRSVDEQFSDLNVSGNAVVHDRLLVKDLVASTILLVPAGKTLKTKELSGNLENARSKVVPWLHPPLEIVAAELFSDASVNISVGSASAGTQIFNLASAPARVSSAYSQPLGSSGSPANVSLNQDVSLHIVANASSTDIVTVKVYYYEQ